jgi:trk system potassium uptake protein
VVNRIMDMLWERPARIVALSFLLVALVGAALLMLPAATTVEEPMSFLNAFFTAVSAVCVTGLIVVDTPVYFTLFGQLVILSLIQIGGLGIMAFSLAVVFLTRKRLSVGETELLSYMLNEEDRTTLRGQLVSVIAFTLTLELLGAALLTVPMYRAGVEAPVWIALFHAVSAFCNAGFSLFSDSLVRFSGNLTVNFTVSLLIIAGGLGFFTLTVLRDDVVKVFRYISPFGSDRERPFLFRNRPELRYLRSESAVVSLRGTAILLTAGFITFYLFEADGVLQNISLGEKYLQSFFQSVTLRTAGFNTADISLVRPVTLLLMIPFMFVGAASGGTAGGIKLGTLATIWADMKRFVTGQEDAVLLYRRVPRRTIAEAYILVVGGIAIVFLASLVLVVTESAPLEELLFEIVSALGTVGLSAGVTGELSVPGRWIVIALMFLGRLGPLTLVVALRPKQPGRDVKYPDGIVPIG